MTRDISTPTVISILISEDYLQIKDLNGKTYIFPKSDKEKIGERLIKLAENENLPHFDVANATVNNEKFESSSEEIIGNIFNPDNVKKELFRAGLNLLGGINKYPRG